MPTAKTAAKSSHPVRVTNQDLLAWSDSLSEALDELRKATGAIDTMRSLAALQAGSTVRPEEVIDLLDPVDISLAKADEQIEEITAAMRRLA